VQAYFLRNYYRTYVTIDGNVTYYATESELATGMVEQLVRTNSSTDRQRINQGVFAAGAQTQTVGIYRGTGGQISVVYMVC
jgi:hypothetical protein